MRTAWDDATRNGQRMINERLSCALRSTQCKKLTFKSVECAGKISNELFIKQQTK
jgi:hypothetical protein